MPCGLASGATLFVTGHAQSKLILAWVRDALALGPLKLVGTALSSISGITGGILSPSFAVGAGLGYDFPRLVSWIPVGFLAVMSLVAYFSGVSRRR